MLDDEGWLTYLVPGVMSQSTITLAYHHHHKTKEQRVVTLCSIYYESTFEREATAEFQKLSLVICTNVHRMIQCWCLGKQVEDLCEPVAVRHICCKAEKDCSDPKPHSGTRHWRDLRRRNKKCRAGISGQKTCSQYRESRSAVWKDFV